MINNNPFEKIEDLPEFDGHRLVSFFYDAPTGLRGFIVIHRGGLISPALGATRFWKYDSEILALRDALRLSRMMSYKSALAGLRYGGAKAVIIEPRHFLKDRVSLFRAYAKKLNYLGGKFVTGTDVGMEDSDINTIKEETSYVIGKRVDPARFTAESVLLGIETALQKIFGRSSTIERSFAIQGVGKTGFNVLKLLYKESKQIFVADIDDRKIKIARKSFPKIKAVKPADIHKQCVDVFVPCALSGVINSKTVSELHCKIIAGSANNQLDSDHIGKLLLKLEILYIPDYVLNAGGLISVVDEYEHGGHPNDKRIQRKISAIGKTLAAILNRSERERKATNIVANEIAEKIFNSRN